MRFLRCVQQYRCQINYRPSLRSKMYSWMQNKLSDNGCFEPQCNVFWRCDNAFEITFQWYVWKAFLLQTDKRTDTVFWRCNSAFENTFQWYVRKVFTLQTDKLTATVFWRCDSAFENTFQWHVWKAFKRQMAEFFCVHTRLSSHYSFFFFSFFPNPFS